MKIFIVMGVGILIGRFLMTGRIKKWNERLAMLCTLLLIFSMGVMLGQKENFLSELSSLGLKSFLFFLIPTLVSIILVYILTKRFMEKKHSDYTAGPGPGTFLRAFRFQSHACQLFKPALRYDFIHTDVFCGNQHRNAQRHPQKNPPVSSENPYYPPWHYSGLCHRRADLRSDPGYFSGRGRCCGKRNGLVQSCGSYHQPSGRRGTGKYCLYEQSYERIFLFFPNSHYCLQAQ